MSNTTTARNNLVKAADLLAKEAEGREFADDAELVAYLSDLDQVVEKTRAIRALYAKRIAVISSQKSRAKKKARIAAALALLAEKEAAENEAQVTEGEEA